MTTKTGLPTITLARQPEFQFDKRQDGWKLLWDPKPQGDSSQLTLEFLEFVSGEAFVKGEKMLKRARKLGHQASQHDAELMLANQEKIPAELRPYTLVFTGTGWQVSSGNRGVAVLRFIGGQWRLLFGWLGDGFGADDRLVRLRA